MSNKIDKPKQTAPQLITKMKGLSENFYYSNSASPKILLNIFV